MVASLGTTRGTYIIRARLASSGRLMFTRRGRRRVFDLGEGYLLYVGSAMGGLRVRVAIRLRKC